LGRAIEKEIRDFAEAARFKAEILARPSVIELVDPGVKRDEAATMADRYTTRAVLVAETQVLRAADLLTANPIHEITERQRAAVLSRFKTMTGEQRRAFEHATGESGLALIDGQAGTGKSFTLAAVREAYEAAGCRVIGLAPSNKVAAALSDDGFKQADTIHKELFLLNLGKRSWNPLTVVVVDEAGMVDTKMMAMLTAHAAAAGAKLILAGDDRQLSSIDYGGMFGALVQKHGAASITQVQRQTKTDDRRASEMLAEKNYSGALAYYERANAITWTRTQGEARAALIEQWAKDSAGAPEKTRFVFAYTNADVATLNTALRAIRKERGELGQDHELTTAQGRASFAAGDRIQFNGTDKKLGIANGAAGTIQKIEGSEVTVKLDRKKAETITFNAATFDKFSHGYAGTIYKGQGATVDQSYLYHSEHWKAAASYVAVTRHRDSVALFVARNTAKDLKELARQMARSEEKRAASMFTPLQDLPARLLTPAELLATVAPEFAQAPTEQAAATVSPAAATQGQADTAARQAQLARTRKQEAARIVREETEWRQLLGLEDPATEKQQREEQERTRTQRRKRGRSL
jgi:Ti-type conjugative transfer relaxase TraA